MKVDYDHTANHNCVAEKLLVSIMECLQSHACLVSKHAGMSYIISQDKYNCDINCVFSM